MKEINHPFVFWSDVNKSAIHALINEDGYLSVIAACEKNNPVDSNAVMILLSAETLISKIISTIPIVTLNGKGIEVSGYIRLGYLQRLENTPKDEIFNFISQQNGCFINGVLHRTGKGCDLNFMWFKDDEFLVF